MREEGGLWTREGLLKNIVELFFSFICFIFLYFTIMHLGPKGKKRKKKREGTNIHFIFCATYVFASANESRPRNGNGVLRNIFTEDRRRFRVVVDKGGPMCNNVRRRGWRK
jgi:hypothetical protein